MPRRRRKLITPDARLLHDLLIVGDEILEFWHAYDPHMAIDMTGFDVDRYFPSELSWEALCIDWLAPFGYDQLITCNYPGFPVWYLRRLKEVGSWARLQVSDRALALRAFHRFPTRNEIGAVSKIAGLIDSAVATQLLSDLQNAVVEDDGNFRVFHIDGYIRPPYRGQNSFGVTGSMLDRDGKELAVDLYADHLGRLLGLEIIRTDGGDVVAPQWATLRLY